MKGKSVIVDLGYHHAEEIDDYRRLMHLYASSSGQHQYIAESVNLYVIRHLNQEKQTNINGVNYWFLKGKKSPLWLPFRLHHRIQSHKPDIILLHGFAHPIQFILLKIQTRACIVLQYHGGGFPQGIKAFLHRLIKGLVKNYVFVAEAQAEEFKRRKMISKNSTIHCIGEGSSHKVKIEKQKARNELRMDANDRICLWVGRLNPNKDPLTLLKGFEIVLEKYNKLRLFMIFNTNELLEDVKQLIKRSPALSQHVVLVGNLAHESLDNYYSAADYFVLGSHEEGSGYALCEALACGCIPVVTDIPSFRSMTNGASFGALWKVGDAASFAECLNLAIEMNLENESQKAIEFFYKELSFQAIAQKQLNMFKSILG